MAGGGAVLAIREAERAKAGAEDVGQANLIYKRYGSAGPSPQHKSSSFSRAYNEQFTDDVEAQLVTSDSNCSPKSSICVSDVKCSMLLICINNFFDDNHKLLSDHMFQDMILRLNIGGSSYRIRTRSIVKFGPMTLLGRFVRMNHDHRKQWADWYFEDSEEYFFERVPRYFDPIYDFYATGRLHVPKDLCFDKFMAELRFWAVSKSKMDECCSPFAQYCILSKTTADTTVEFQQILLLFFNNKKFLHLLSGERNTAFVGTWLTCRRKTPSLECGVRSFADAFGLSLRAIQIRKVNQFFRWWKAFEITSSSFVVLSIAALILGSIPEFQVPERSKDTLSQNAQPSQVNPTYHPNSADDHQTNLKIPPKTSDDTRLEMVEHPVFNHIENICVVYFTLEYLLRFCVAPRKWSFAKQFLNVIDLLAILPFFFEIILAIVGIRGDNIRKVRWAFLTVRLLRILRIIRIVKLGRFSPGLANFALTIRKSKKQMQMVAIVMLTVIVFFSTLVYFLEKDEPNTTFTSIPASFWWAVVTMSTVGYGDSVPQTIGTREAGWKWGDSMWGYGIGITDHHNGIHRILIPTQEQLLFL
ncbi:unnamed protein product [Anisakis simplex]|uniref:Potassium voltage-gated channel subfamily F member 1 (inferred by orthology to a human protein) n=1 Tax=Anisakis simplex TaxID=6269 RepID=A0A0M3JT17_ANISI|nr:unnamed protein product [Anisakis simplex]